MHEDNKLDLKFSFPRASLLDIGEIVVEALADGKKCSKMHSLHKFRSFTNIIYS